MRDGAPIAGAAELSYTVAQGDIGQSLTCEITAANDAGSVTVTSAALQIPEPSANPPGTTGTGGSSGSGDTGTSGSNATTGGDASGTSTGQGGKSRVCVVPTLKKLTLGEARKALTRADCSLGEARKPARVPRNDVLLVTGQSVKHGSERRSGYPVNITLSAVRK